MWRKSESERVEGEGNLEKSIYREIATERYTVERKTERERVFLVRGRRRIIHHRQTFERIAGHTSHTVIDEHVHIPREYDHGRK